MTMREVRAPSAPSQGSEYGAWPRVWRHGWKWSLMKTDSKPTSSARHAKSSNSLGENCSADALYPSLNMASRPAIGLQGDGSTDDFGRDRLRQLWRRPGARMPLCAGHLIQRGALKRAAADLADQPFHR